MSTTSSKAKHADADAIKRVGTKAIMEHFAIGAPAVSLWRRDGIPRNCRNPMILLGESLGHDMSDLKLRQEA